jgi:hypothetical protein
MPQERVARCGARTLLGSACIRVADGVANFGGVVTCGSVWMCPSCAAKIAESRRQEVRDLVDAHLRRGGVVYMAAFTVPHQAWHQAKALKDAVAGCWSGIIAGKPWIKAKEWSGFVGYVRALEVTHGANGWHPHLHVLFLLEDDRAAAEFGVWLFERWARSVARKGLGDCNPSIWRFERAAHYEAATDYVIKGNFDMELTRGHMKLAKGGGRTPWQLLDAADNGDRRAAALFRDFATAFKGARQLTFSAGLRDNSPSDEVLSAEELGDVIGHIPAKIFAKIVHRGLECAVLEAAEDGGWSAVVSWLRMGGRYWGGAPYDRYT